MKRINLKHMVCFINIFIVLISIFPNKVQADDTSTKDILDRQKDSFGISEFVKETQEYSKDIFPNLNINEILDSAITGNIDNKAISKHFFALAKKNISKTMKTLISILVIVLIHSILKSITDDLSSSNISKIIYYVQYILIVTIILNDFTGILKDVNDTINNLCGFINVLIPLLMSLMLYTGSITTTAVIQPILLFGIEFIGNIIKTLILPFVSIIVATTIISKMSERIQVQKLNKFMKSSVVWALGIILTIFVGSLSLEGTLTSSVDGITAKTAKAAVSNLIPVVGKVLGDGVDTILGCGLVLKNAVGLVGTVVCLGICIVPIIRLALFVIMYDVLSAVTEPIADKKIVGLLEEFGGIFKLLLAILCSVAFLLIIGITLVIKISNSGMMYR